MMEMRERAWAKLNLTLDVTGRLDGGYHAMEMIMQTCSVYDGVYIAAHPGTGAVTVRTNRRYLPVDGDNIAGKAVRAFFAAAGTEKAWDVEVRLEKRIPVCAGLGGGSADAAAVLRGMNRLFKTGLDAAALEEIGGRIGADVPFCIRGGTALARGRGEVLTPLTPLAPCGFVLCKPKMSISTPELFARIDCGRIRCRPDTAAAVSALETGNVPELARRMYNVFEDVLGRRAAAIAEIKSALYDAGALGAVMSGTGSAVFGVFSDRAQARRAQAQLAGRYAFCAAAEPVGTAEI